MTLPGGDQVTMGLTEPRNAPSDSPAFIPSPTVEKFILSVARGPLNQMRLLILMGIRGVGKTSGAVAALVALAERVREENPQALPIKVACVRDTFVNLERTTFESIRDFARKGLPVYWRDANRQAWIGHPKDPPIKIYFFGLDQEGDADKLQGFAMSVLWLEEVAPAAGYEAGVPATALGLGGTSLRQDGVPPRILVTLNPPDRDHWILKVEQYLADQEMGDVLVHRFEVPNKEKSEHFEALSVTADTAEERKAWSDAATAFERYTQRNRAFLASIGRHDLVKRLVEGQIGDVQIGEPVVPTFSRALHVSKEPIVIYPHWPILRSWDGGGSPSTVFLQPLGVDGRDGVNILGSHTSENTSMEAHIRDWVLPFMSRYGLLAVSPGSYGEPRRRVRTYRDIVDPSMLHEGKTSRGDQSTTGAVVSEMLGASIEPGPVDWASRREALSSVFERAGLGDRARFAQIDPEENDLLVTALAGRFRYPKNIATGRIEMTVEAAKRVSGLYGGTPDALAYALSMLYPAWQWLRRSQQMRAPAAPRAKVSWLAR